MAYKSVLLRHEGCVCRMEVGTHKVLAWADLACTVEGHVDHWDLVATHMALEAYDGHVLVGVRNGDEEGEVP